eukprot:1943413-Rhodomonas_salina.1
MLTIPEDELEVEEPGETSTPAEYKPYVLRSSTSSNTPAHPPVPEELPIEVLNHPRDLRAALAAGVPAQPSLSPSISAGVSRSASPAPQVINERGVPDPVNDASNDPLAWTSGLASGETAGISDQYFDEAMEAHAIHAEEPVMDDSPTTFEEAKASPYWKHWQAALIAERKSLEARGVWNQIETLPYGAKLLKAKVVYKQKKNAKGKVVRFKCRCTAKGNAQIELVHYYDTFAAVASGAY